MHDTAMNYLQKINNCPNNPSASASLHVPSIGLLSNTMKYRNCFSACFSHSLPKLSFRAEPELSRLPPLISSRIFSRNRYYAGIGAYQCFSLAFRFVFRVGSGVHSRYDGKWWDELDISKPPECATCA